VWPAGYLAYPTYTSLSLPPQEVIAAVHTVQAFSGAKRETNRYEDQIEGALVFEKAKAHTHGVSHGFFMFSMGLTYGISIMYGLILIANGDIQLFEMFGVLLNVTNAGIALGASGSVLPELAKGRAAIKALYKLVDRVPRRAPFVTPMQYSAARAKFERLAAMKIAQEEASARCGSGVDAGDPGAATPMPPGIGIAHLPSPSVGGTGIVEGVTPAAVDLVVAGSPPTVGSVSHYRYPATNLQEAADRTEKLLSPDPASVQGAIRFHDVWFTYPTRSTQPVLRGFTLDIEPGTTVALVGGSGCGKSTAISLLQRVYDRDTGVVALDGHDVNDLDLDWLRSQIGVVGQEPTLFSGTILDKCVSCVFVSTIPPLSFSFSSSTSLSPPSLIR
jgi:ABC-type multidrug transport system fused ATPase/permease subunit